MLSCALDCSGSQMKILKLKNRAIWLISANRKKPRGGGVFSEGARCRCPFKRMRRTCLGDEPEVGARRARDRHQVMILPPPPPPRLTTMPKTKCSGRAQPSAAVREIFAGFNIFVGGGVEKEISDPFS